MTDPDPAPRRQARRFLVEMVVVAAGVFLGLAADAAWDGRQDRAREARYRANLLTELRAAQAELRADDELRRQRLVALDSLLAQLRQRTAPDSTIARWMDEGDGFSAFFPPTAVLEDLISSGNLQLIRSDELRFALMAYYQERPRLRFVEENERYFIYERLRPFLLERMSEMHPAESSAIDSLFSSRTFANLISRRRGSVAFVLNWSEGVGALLDEAVTILERD